MDVFVREDDIALLGERRDGGHAGEVARCVDVARLAAQERGEFRLELEVKGARAVRDAGAGGARAPPENGRA